MNIRANKLPMFLVAVLAVLGALIFLRSMSTDDAQRATDLMPVPETPPPDDDSPADTVRSLRAGVANMQSTFEVMSQENNRLLDENRDLQTQLQRVQQQIKNDVAADKQSSSALSKLSQRIDALAGNVSSMQLPAQNVPPGLGLEDAALSARDGERIAWVYPTHYTPEQIAQARAAPKPARKAPPAPEQAAAPEALALKPAYTIAENMVLAGSTAFSALVGRIPLRGRVEDPFPFFVLVGADNLAANGLKLPEVSGIVFRGEAFGDLNLTCVRGVLVSATFIFKDATVRTVSGDKEAPLGTLADEFGVPCVSGRLITDAPQYLSRRVLVSAVGAAGDAAAAAQTTNTISGLTGTGTSTRTGDVAAFILGRTTSDAANDIEAYLDARFRQSWDAIFARPGTTVSLLIERELAIDYDPQGRRLRYDTAHTTPHRRRLD